MTYKFFSDSWMQIHYPAFVTPIDIKQYCFLYIAIIFTINQKKKKKKKVRGEIIIDSNTLSSCMHSPKWKASIVFITYSLYIEQA